MPWSKAASSNGGTERVDWVDYAKGWCIILVVMMHATLGVEDALGRETWLHGFIAWARPFRMPDFFLVAGLFLSRTIDRPWRDYLDRKALHFAYFFVLWTVIQGAPKWLLAGDDLPTIMGRLAFAMIEPFGTLWFIYLLPIFFVTTKLLRRAPPEAILLFAAALEIAEIHTGSTVIDEFAERYIYFYAGYLFAPQVFRLAEMARNQMFAAGAALLAWGTVNALAVTLGVAALPGVSLVLGFAGAAAVVWFSALLAETGRASSLKSLGAQSLAVYLAFILPVAASRIALFRAGLVFDGGCVALLLTAIGVIVPTFVKYRTKDTSFAFLFERPASFRLPPPQSPEQRTNPASRASSEDWPCDAISCHQPTPDVPKP
ncbi:acyltransferase family protein [Methylocystis parvus]|uniref:acyltransferase family protein n=1 Tax=Methylocystis parvus TaxID=134 RepID=UPI003C7337AB